MLNSVVDNYYQCEQQNHDQVIIFCRVCMYKALVRKTALSKFPRKLPEIIPTTYSAVAIRIMKISINHKEN